MDHIVMHMPGDDGKVGSLVDDVRVISSVNGPHQIYIVGRDGIAKIVAYNECGEMAHVPWLAMINEAGNIIKRMDARNVTVNYVDESDDKF